MNRITTTLIFTALAALSSQVIANDSTTTNQKQQVMKDCMTREMTRDRNMSETAVKTLCQKKINMKKEGNDLTTGAPEEKTPHN